MCKTFKYESFGFLLWMFASVLTLAKENNFSHHYQERPLCQPGFYCPPESFGPVPCPKGTYGPAAGASSIDSCLKCPPHHYCPRPGLSAALACGSMAQQPLTGQDSCICTGEGQSFQVSDGRCHCTIGYQPTKNGNVCKHKFYDVCRDGKTRTQYGGCLDKHQWSLHCRQQVCLSAEDYHGYDRELGLCVCKEVPGTVLCGDLCRSRPADELHLHCRTSGDLELVWSHDSKVLAVSGRELEMLFKQWDSQGTLLCSSHPTSTRPVYIVLTTDTGFLGLLSGLPEELRRLFPVIKPQDLNSSAVERSDFQKEVTEVENISHGSRKTNSSRTREDKRDAKEELKSVTGVHNPTACLNLGDVILFTVDMHHYPQYDLDSLYNTNKDFDWGTFRQLKEELMLSWTPPSFFSVLFSQPGVYVFTLSSHQHKHLYVRVMPAGVQCYEAGPFFPSIPRHVTRVGISRRRNLLLRPDWLVTGGLLLGAVVVLCLCVTVLILFREYGWPAKEKIKARYRLLQLAYHMDDYSSKVSRVISLRKTHRSQQARMARDTVQAACTDSMGEFWDYEHQVDLEAFSSNTFYRLLLKQNLSVTTHLGQLTTEVKELYQGVLGKLQLIQPCLMTEERVGEGYERIKREVEKEVARRKSLGSQLRTLLNSQLQVLRQEQQAQQRVYTAFTTHLRECTRLLSKIYSNNQPLCELQQNLMQRLTSLVDEMGDLVSGECQRQGAWELLGEGPGAKLLCPDSGAVLTKEHIFGPDGSLCASRALHFDSVTGLIKPNARTHMLLSSCHTMAVPPNFFLHPQTCRVLPIVGNVAFDAASSTLVFMNCPGDNRKLDSPVLPFIPYPTTCLSDQPLPSTQLRGLGPGQILQFGAPMTDADTGVPVPILAVTIHPQTGLVCPLGGVHICPITRLPQPIQIGYPMLDPRTGNMVLTAGVSLDPATGGVLPVGGVLLAESFIEPLSGQMLRIEGASIRMGQVLPNSGGYQTLLSMKGLAEMFKVLDILKPITEEWASDQVLQHPQPHAGSDRASGQQEHLLAVTKELQQAWGRSVYCHLQLQTRLESLLDWAICLQQDGGILGEIPLPGSDMCVPALLGMEYPDPVGSGVSVPVLGCKTDLCSGIATPLAGTMEDPDGKGLVAIRCGSQTVDPVTGVLAPVIGARLDVSRKNVLPVTASYWLTAMDHTDSVQVEALQREVCARNIYWQHQRQREEDFLSDLDLSLSQYLFRITQFNYSQQVQWSGRQLREAVLELRDSSETEAQRRAAQHYPLALIVPPHVLHILTLGDEEEWDHQALFHSELLLGLDKVDVCMEQLQQDQEKWTAQGGDWAATVNALAREMRHRDVWEQCMSRQTELETALAALHFVRHHSQLRANTAQAVLCGNLWYREFGLVQCQQPREQTIGLLQQRMLPILERLNQLLEDKQPQHSSVLSAKQAYGLEIDSRVWTSSMPVVKGNSNHSLREPLSLAQSQDTVLQTNSAPTHNSQQTASLGIHSQAEEKPRIAQTEEDWNKLLQLSPLFHLLRAVELQLRGWACGAGLLQGERRDGGKSFVDVLDAQWECEGELIPLDLSVLNPREFLVYQHGLFLIHTLHNLNLTPPISLHIAASLPNNNYLNNAFRNSFFYQELEGMLFVRRQRLHSVGGFSLLLLHCLSHIKVKDMTTDSSPVFQRLFYKVIQACLGELFQTRLDMPPCGQEANWCSGGLHRTLSDSLDSSLFDKLHKPSRGLLSEEEVGQLQGKLRETSLFYHLESLLREKNSTEKGGD